MMEEEKLGPVLGYTKGLLTNSARGPGSRGCQSLEMIPTDWCQREMSTEFEFCFRWLRTGKNCSGLVSMIQKTVNLFAE